MWAEWCDGVCTDHLELQVADWSLVEQFVLGTAVTMAPLLLNENSMSSLLRMIINNNLLNTNSSKSVGFHICNFILFITATK